VHVQYVMVQLNPDQLMSFGGSSEPCAHCTLSVLGKAKNAEFSKQMMAKIQQDLNIQPNRLVFVVI
jgi:phenylpyruvate tautomerase